MIKKILISALLLYVALHASLVFAQSTPPPIVPPNTGGIAIPSGSYQGSNQGLNLNQNFLPKITQTVIALTGALAVLFIIVGAIQILTAYGKTEKIEAAKKTITWAIVGLLIAILSYAIVSVISAIQL